MRYRANPTDREDKAMYRNSQGLADDRSVETKSMRLINLIEYIIINTEGTFKP